MREKRKMVSSDVKVFELSTKPIETTIAKLMDHDSEMVVKASKATILKALRLRTLSSS